MTRLALVLALLAGDTLRPGLAVRDEGVAKGQAATVNCTGTGVTCSVAAGVWTLNGSGGGGGAPTTAQYWLGAVDGLLPNGKSLSGFTGLVLNTAGTPSAKAANTCTSQFPRSDNASGVWTCASIASGDLPAATTALGAVKHAANCSAGNHVNGIGVGGELSCTADSGGGAPTTASYWTATTEAGLSAEVNLGALTTGILKHSVAVGVSTPATASAGTDYGPPTSGNATGLVLSTTGTGAHTAYGGTSCTNQFPRSLNASGAATCAGIGVADFTANQGTTSQVLHGNAAGQPSWAAIAIGELPTITIAKGGTGVATIADDQLIVGTGADTTAVKTLTNCTGASDALSYNTATNTFGCTTITAGAPSFSGLTQGGIMYANTTTTIASTTTGTANQVLHGNGTGASSFSAVDLSADTAATALPVSKGGMGKTTLTSAGAIPIGTTGTTTYIDLAGGAAGSILYNSAANTPAWLTTGSSTGLTLMNTAGGTPTWDRPGYRVSGSNYTNGTTTVSDITGLSWAVASGVPSAFRCQMAVLNGNSGSAIRYAVNGPTMTTVAFKTKVHKASVTTEVVENFTAVSSTVQTAGVTTGVATTAHIDTIEGVIIPSANGTMQIRAAGSAAQTSTVYQGSSCFVF